MPIERVTKELLERELNSRRFLDGLEATIDIANAIRPIINGNRLEVRFQVEKELYGTGIGYPSDIIIGTEKTAGIIPGRELAEELFRKHTGKNPHNDDNAEEYVCFCMEHRLEQEEYPKVPREFSSVHRPGQKYYTLLDLHTHPSGILAPSKGDSNCITYLRNQCVDFGIHTKPIMLIVGATEQDSREGSYPILFLQEKRKNLLDDEEKIEARRYAGRYAGRHIREDKKLPESTYPEELMNPLIKIILEQAKKLSKQKARPLYNCGLAYFTPGAKALDFDFDLGKFAYMARWRK